MTADGDTPGARRGAVTLRDIASAIGVSRATVSLVLRGSPLVHASTRARVEAELDRQNYVYNRAAANLRQRTSSSVALVINDLSNRFLPSSPPVWTRRWAQPVMSPCSVAPANRRSVNKQC